MTTDSKIIVVAWAEQTALVPTGRYVTRDMNLFPEFRVEWEGKACIWLNRGKRADVQKANDYATQNGLKVFTFPTTEHDPLGKAKAAAVAARAGR